MTFDQITWDEFMRVALHFGTIIRAEEFAEARKPAYKLWVDFGPEIGVRKSSSQITKAYPDPAVLIGKQVLCVLNFGDKQVGPFISQFLTTGADTADGEIVLVTPEKPVPNGARLL
jgi:tRNA-binding protein